MCEIMLDTQLKEAVLPYKSIVPFARSYWQLELGKVIGIHLPTLFLASRAKFSSVFQRQMAICIWLFHFCGIKWINS